VWVRHTVEHVSGQARKRVGRGFVCDIQAEKEFQLESLRVSEREQNRIGQDLHDDLCQVLAGVSCLMRVFEGRVAAKAPEEIEWLKELNQQIVDAMHRTRALTHGLFPGKIQIADIRGALLELASQVKTRFKVDINTQFVGRFPKHSSGQIIQIYRISQEAMSNAIKHGRATQISVRLEAQPSVMELSVTDNGTGFSKTENQAPGVGTNIMKYRANMLGGDVSVIDQAPHGVCVRLRYPFETS
jgi:signal transduction histidine kinase